MAKTRLSHLGLSSELEKPFASLEIDLPIETPNHDQLAKALQCEGEMKLLQGDIAGLHYFDMAAQVAPEDIKLFLDQGLALFEYGSDKGKEKGLKLACRKFKAAIALDPKNFKAWHTWGNALYLLGIRSQEMSFFLNAKEKYLTAENFLTDEPPEVLADFQWDLGDIWKKLAEHSGEADDLNLAMQAFEKSTKLKEEKCSVFWKTYGQVTLSLAEKTNDMHLLVKAISHLKKAVSYSISTFEYWHDLAVAVKTLYSYTHDEDHFSQANECFSTAAKLKPKDAKHHFEWAKLLADGGRWTQDSKKLHSCLDRCKRAAHLNRKNPLVYGLWSQALAVIGQIEEKLEYLYESEEMIDRALEKHDHIPELWLACGDSLFAQAEYFSDLDLYYQAIEKYQYGLSINRSFHKLWFAIAKTFAKVADLESEPKTYDRAVKFFERALKLRVTSHYHYHLASTLLAQVELHRDQNLLEKAIYHFEEALFIQKNARYLYPEWLFKYACALDMHGDYADDESRYVKSLELLNHVLMLDPNYPEIHYQLALVHAHYGEFINDADYFTRSLHHYRISSQKDKENDQIMLDWAITLINFAELFESQDSNQTFREAEFKMMQAIRLGNTHAYFHLSCLYSLLGDHTRSIYFLEKARAFDSLPPIDELLEDDWLEGTRTTEAFRLFLEALQTSSTSKE